MGLLDRFWYWFIKKSLKKFFAESLNDDRIEQSHYEEAIACLETCREIVTETETHWGEIHLVCAIEASEHSTYIQNRLVQWVKRLFYPHDYIYSLTAMHEDALQYDEDFLELQGMNLLLIELLQDTLQEKYGAYK